MPALDRKHRSAAAKKAALSRSCSPGSARLIEADRDLAAARLEDYVRRTLAAAPDLTDAQKQTIALMLAPRLTGSGDAA